MAEYGGEQPLLSSVHGGCGRVLNGEDCDTEPIDGVADLAKEFLVESKKLWYLAGPAIFTSFCQYGLMTIIQIFAGHLGTIQLAAVSVENSIIAGFPYGLMFGLSSALETYCGQAFGANQFEMLGIYMQKSWVILNAMAFAAVPLFIFATPVLKLLGQTASISREAGKFALWMIPQQFAYAMMLPSTKFLQAQSKVMAIAVIAAVAFCLHGFFSWLLIGKLGWGLPAAAVVLNWSWWFIALAQFLYVISGTCGEAWPGFSWTAFEGLWKFLKISVACAVMMCLELWYIMALTLFAGYLEDAEISVDALSICNTFFMQNLVLLHMIISYTCSVRVSNELGSRHPRKARFSVVVSGVTSLLIGILFTLILVLSRKQYPAIFSNSSEVQQLVEKLTPLLGISVVFTNVQYTLSGVAIGAGWQAPVAYMSTVCYFIFGVPLGVLMAFKFKMGVQGIWCGMVIGL
ncbi:putative membrane protein, predicted efflux pump [Handroanthus impetiginosus]|uniref:Protein DETOXIFICATION n=1 Tax=Handroanthus impetiginosus TaxID=429701 RepID=A0A2G9GJ63_9LAMI|nr:putative membrane protein, predicted efflux pump [Handroanthus impetiginosus]